MPIHKEKRTDTPLYRGGAPERNLVVVIDADSVEDAQEAVTRDGLLTGLLADSSIVVYRYSDAGAPADAEMLTTDFWPPAPIGWLTATPHPESGMTSHVLIFSDSDRFSRAAIFTGLVASIAAMIAKSLSVTAAGPFDSEALLVLAASEIHADILVTNRPSLLQSRPLNTPERIAVFSTAEALGAIGLYLRARGKYFGTKSRGAAITYNRGNFWDSAVRLYVRDYFDVSGRALQLDQSRGTDGLVLFAFSSIRRAARALERRDAVWRHINQNQDRDVAEDTLAIVESMLLFLMGSLDVTAKFVDGVFAINVSGGNPAIGWQKQKWMKGLAAKASRVAELFKPGSSGEATVETLRLLRNTIHDVGLEAVSVHDSNREQLTWVSIPEADKDDVLAGIAKLGGKDKWGIHIRDDGRTFVDVGPLIENLIAYTLYLLGDIYAAVAVEVATTTSKPPMEPSPQFSDELVDLHLQWQLCLDEPWPELP